MAIPNLAHIVHQVRASQNWPFRSKEQLCAYSHACIVAFYNTDPDFGKLRKISAQNHCVDSSGLLGAVDVALYKSTGQIVDFISSAGFEPDLTKPEPPNLVTWRVGPENEYGPNDWFAPGNVVPNPPSNELEQRISMLERQMNVLLNVHVSGLQSQITELAHQIAELHQLFVSKAELKSLLPEYEGRAPLFGGTVISRPR